MSSNFFAKIQNKIEKFSHTDIPLEQDIQTRLVITLITLMSFMLILSCAGVIILNNIANKWSSGLENKITIEITAESKNGNIISQSKIQKETQRVYKAIKSDSAVKSAKILDEKEIRELISPWVGNDLTLDGIPIPGLIAIETKTADANTIKRLRQTVKSSSKYANLETHKEWLNDFLTLLSSLKTIGTAVAALVFVITITSIATAMHTRLSLYKKDVKLLHLMGADDKYIVKQFTPHAVIITLKGSVIGVLCALLTIIATSTMIGTTIIPEHNLSILWYATLSLSPIFITFIAYSISRVTLLHTLMKMP